MISPSLILPLVHSRISSADLRFQRWVQSSFCFRWSFSRSRVSVLSTMHRLIFRTSLLTSALTSRLFTGLVFQLRALFMFWGWLLQLWACWRRVSFHQCFEEWLRLLFWFTRTLFRALLSLGWLVWSSLRFTRFSGLFLWHSISIFWFILSNFNCLE